jgi:hypothetical protein
VFVLVVKSGSVMFAIRSQLPSEKGIKRVRDTNESLIALNGTRSPVHRINVLGRVGSPQRTADLGVGNERESRGLGHGVVGMTQSECARLSF